MHGDPHSVRNPAPPGFEHESRLGEWGIATMGVRARDRGISRERGEVKVVVSERVHVVFRASAPTDTRSLPQVEALPSGPLRLVAETAGPPGNELERRWLVEVAIDLGGVNLDPEYWLRHCYGFLVDSESGQCVGVVDDVDLASGSDRGTALVVASGWFGRNIQTIAVADVQAIVPSERRLIVKEEAAYSAAAIRERA